MKKIIIGSIIILLLTSCVRESVFTAPVITISEPDEVVELSVERIQTDHMYSEFFAVYDTILISARPNDTDYNFYVSSIKNNKLLGSYMRHGQGPKEYIGLNPIYRIDVKGYDLTALTYAPHKRQLIEWNITQSIKTGKDSLLLLGDYAEPNEYDLTYARMYKIGKSRYLGYTTGFFPYGSPRMLLPTYWILDGQDTIAPVNGISVVKDMIYNEESVVSAPGFFSSAWELRPDNSKVFSAMTWLKQANIIDLNDNSVRSYRVDGSPDERIFKTNMEGVVLQYCSVVCDNDHIYALYSGEHTSAFKDNMGYRWIHEFDWNGNFIRKYHLSVPLFFLYMDPATGTVYGYNYDDDNVIYKIIQPSYSDKGDAEDIL